MLLDRSRISPKMIKSRGQTSGIVQYRYTDTKEAKSIVRSQFEFRGIKKWLNFLPKVSGFKRPTFIITRSILNQQKLSELLPADTPAGISSGLEELGFKAVSLSKAGMSKVSSAEERKRYCGLVWGPQE